MIKQRQIKHCHWTFLMSLVLGCSLTTFAQSNPITRIDIKSKWGGLGPAAASILSIKEKHGEFYADGRRLQKGITEQLLRELATLVTSPTAENLGLSESWLEANAVKALPKHLLSRPQNERDLFLNFFRNPEAIATLVPALLSGGWTDDFPSFEMAIKKADSSMILVSSQRQNIFMLPLVIEERGARHFSYNANLSRAIAALLPPKFTERDRLNGERLVYVLSEQLMRHLHNELALLEARNEIGTELKRLEEHYTLKETALNYISSVDIDTLKERFLRWNAKLQRNDLPANVIIGVSLPYENKNLRNFDLFLSQADSLVALPLSVPWFAEYLQKHPTTTVEVRFVTDRSVSEKAFAYFSDTLRLLSAEQYLSEVQKQIPDSVFLEVSQEGRWSRWIVLPDRRMVLFDFRGDEVLNWQVSDFVTRTRFDTGDWHMARALISPQGKIEIR